jgi:hypothetical protein
MYRFLVAAAIGAMLIGRIPQPQHRFQLIN